MNLSAIFGNLEESDLKMYYYIHNTKFNIDFYKYMIYFPKTIF